MYVVERKEKVLETLLLKYKEKELKIDVKINIGKTLNEFQKAFRRLQLAQIKIQKEEIEPAELGNAILDIFEIVFGKEDSAAMINFYDGDYTELLMDVYPFILNVVLPAFTKASKQRQKEIKKRVWNL